MINASTPKGTRDFQPADVYKRDYIFHTIKSVFQKYGYQPIETPAMENLSTLLGKYGEEGDKLLFKILNSGDFLDDIPSSALASMPAREMALKISEKGLRYDLTVPFARYVVQHRNEITFPFKRYQIQPVWRADRPQKGRYREFYQCDVDVIGSTSLFNELELIQIIDEIFRAFGISIIIKINHRKILLGICEKYGITDKFNDFVIAIDKLEKAGVSAVEDELKGKGIKINLSDLLHASKMKPSEMFAYFREIFEVSGSETGLKGIHDLKTLFSFLEEINFDQDRVKFDVTLARGLNYYTGCIFEVITGETSIGSVCGGGRYDDLTGIFGMKDISGTGVSFGADRIFDVLNQKADFPEEYSSLVKLLLVNFGDKEAKHCLGLLQKIRKAGIYSELFPEPLKIAKQLNYANVKKIPYVLLIGSKEIERKEYLLKNMNTGEQQSLTLEQIIHTLNS